jgi:hypothetical protein
MLLCLGGMMLLCCLSGRDLSSFEFISVTKQGGFILISLKPIDNRLNIIM